MRWLVKRLPDQRVVVPMGPEADAAQRRAAVLHLTGQERSANEIALELRVHIRLVHRIRAAARAKAAKDAQADLFAPREAPPRAG